MFWFGGIFGIVLFVAMGFVILHFADKEKSFNLKIAGYLLIASGAIMALSAAVMMFFGACSYDGCHGYGMHGSHGMMRSGCNSMQGEFMDGKNMPNVNKGMMKDSTGIK